MSSVQVPAEIVVQACESYLEARRARIERETEQEIARWTGAKIWFWGKPLTREQAEAYCSEELSMIRITGGAWARRAEELLSTAQLAKKCNTFVTVDARMVECLGTHFG